MSSNVVYLPVAAEPAPGPEPYLDKKGLAAFFRCSVRTIEVWVAAGAPIPLVAGSRIGRASEVEAWAKANGHFKETA